MSATRALARAKATIAIAAKGDPHYAPRAMKISVIVAFVSCLAVGCSKDKTSDQTAQKPAPPLAQKEKVVSDCGHGENGAQCTHNGDKDGAKEIRPGVMLYGHELDPNSKPISFTLLVEDPEQFVDKKVKVAGYVRAACKKMGCWMELAASKDKGQGARVVFHDYGFFVPKDSKGAKAVLEAKVQLTRVTPEQVKHYEEEGATFAKKYDDGSAREVRLVASGVELTQN